MPTVSVSSFGSGIDVESLITGLVQANSVTLQTIQNRAASLRTATTTLSTIGSSMSGLATAAEAISSSLGLSSYSATSSNAAVVASANGTALPSSFTINVTSLAKEQRTYSASFASNATALGQTGSFSIKIGSGTAVNIAVTAADTLDTVAGKVNAAGLRASAAVFYDGSSYRLQVRGLDTGAANALTFVETGTSFDLNGDGTVLTGGKTVQTASDAALTIDGFAVTRPTNQVTGAIQGVTLALTDKTTSPVTVTVAGDVSTLKTKVSAVVSAYNSVINAIHVASGFGTQKASNQTLAADSTLRTINDRLTRLVGSQGASSGALRTLADIGIILNQDGTLRVDDTKLSAAVSKDAGGVTTLLARPTGATSGGMMADLKDLTRSLTASDNGILVTHTNALAAQAKVLDKRATSEQTRLDGYADRLRTQLTAMNQSIGKMQTQFASMGKLFG
jgi:flagellar hook-associated protein 2